MTQETADNGDWSTDVEITSVRTKREGIVVKTRNSTYGFPWLFGDRVRGGSKADIEGVVTYGGDSVSKHYVQSYDFDEVPDEVVEAVADNAVVVDGVTGGWARWDGRPEWSDTYVDISDAVEVNPA